SEAAHMGLPVIVERNAWTLPQERYNAEWIQEHGVGIVLNNFRGIAEAVEKLLAGDELRAMKTRLSATHNRAVFEIPPMLEKIFQESYSGASGQACLG
ncbi:MAG: galactosyldiacylglycerol synthase, partial [Bryobacteraceae bacterium]